MKYETLRAMNNLICMDIVRVGNIDLEDLDTGVCATSGGI
jgi:hypothetical protein